VDTQTAQLFFALLTFVAAAGTIVTIGSRLAAGAGSRTAWRFGAAISEAGVWLALLVAVVATLGSLYFSEVAHFVPCRLC